MCAFLKCVLLQLAMRMDGCLYWKYWGVLGRERRMVAVRGTPEPFSFNQQHQMIIKKKDIFLTVIGPQPTNC